MLKSLVECKQSTNFLIIQDKEEAKGQDLFIAFLKNHADNNTIKSINLVCYEFPPETFLRGTKNDKIIPYDYFKDPCGWDYESTEKSDLSVFTSIPKDLSDTVFFIDSLYFLATYHGFYTAYQNLGCLKSIAKTVICLAHGDLFTSLQLEELKSLSSALVKVEECTKKKGKTVEVFYRKPGGKIVNQTEVVTIGADFKVSCRVKVAEEVAKMTRNVKEEIESLATFKLGLEMSENERRAKNELVLPFLRTEAKTSRGGDIIYHQEVEDDMEDDPDDDLDI